MHAGAHSSCVGDIKPDCGWAVTPAFDRQHSLWVAFVSGQHIYVASRDKEGAFLPAIRVNKQPESIYQDGENRPKIAIGNKGEIYISWTEKTPEKFSGNIRFSRSVDGGKSFEAPQTINDDDLTNSHRFDALEVTPSGDIYLVWLDKRNQVAAKNSGQNYPGSAVYYAVSKDSGDTFQANQKVADHSCECCRIAVAASGGSEIAIVWRQLFASEQEVPVRDHAFMTVSSNAVSKTIERATWDNWLINACPHHGPDIEIDSESRKHLVWFTNSEQRKGIYYKKAVQFDQEIEKATIKIVDASPGASHPQVVSLNSRVVIAWKRYDGEKTDLLWMQSNDSGETWSKEMVAANTSQDSDHPLLLHNEREIFISWLDKEHGYRLIAL